MVAVFVHSVFVTHTQSAHFCFLEIENFESTYMHTCGKVPLNEGVHTCKVKHLIAAKTWFSIIQTQLLFISFSNQVL